MKAQSPNPFRWLLPLAIALLSLGVSAFTGYTSNDRETVQRVSVLEAHREDDRKSLEEIKVALKETNAKLTEILVLLSAQH